MGYDYGRYLSVFARGLGIEFEDTYKKYRLSAAARAFVERTFSA